MSPATPMRRATPPRRWTPWILCLLALVACGGKTGVDPTFEAERVEPWSEEVLELARAIPVQQDGRVKPLETLAGFKLLRMNGKRTVRIAPERGEKQALGPTAWALDVLFFPEQARHYQMFLVEDDIAITAIGLEPGAKKRRDRYSWNELQPGFPELRRQAARAREKEARDLDRKERLLIALDSNVREFDSLAGALAMARAELPVDGSERLRSLGVEDRPGVTHVLEAYLPRAQEFRDSPDPEDEQAVRRLATALEDLSRRADFHLALFPPAQEGTQEDGTPLAWLDAGEVVASLVNRDPDGDANLEALALLERMEAAKGDRAAFTGLLRELHDDLVGRAEDRGQYRSVPWELRFYGADPFFKALYCFLGAFVVMALSWLVPRRFLRLGVWGLLGLGEVYLVYGITLRCLVMQRPPIATLYETLPFITAASVLIAAFVERWWPRRVAETLAVLIGAGGLFLTQKFEITTARESGDTIVTLLAVLRTNYWLTIHVITINLGYAASFLAALLSHAWIVMRLFGVYRGDRKFYTGFSRATYGVLAFGLLLTVVGTILGGVWANDSWGRFWGWDPKENGALMIALWELATVHLRLGGHVKQFGLHALNVVLGGIVIFSWFGVNQLGVGLHAYGFTEGVFGALMLYYAIEGAFLALAFGWWFLAGRHQDAGGTPPGGGSGSGGGGSRGADDARLDAGAAPVH